MNAEGPALEALTRRLAETPDALLATEVVVEAVVFDLMLDLGGEPVSPRERARVREAPQTTQRLMLVASGLLSDPAFRRLGVAAVALRWLTNDLEELGRLVAAEAFVRDPERREELARLALAALGLRPAGEAPAQAADRLKTLDTVSRARVVKEMAAREARARELREAMKRREAEEAAARFSPE